MGRARVARRRPPAPGRGVARRCPRPAPRARLRGGGPRCHPRRSPRRRSLGGRPRGQPRCAPRLGGGLGAEEADLAAGELPGAVVGAAKGVVVATGGGDGGAALSSAGDEGVVGDRGGGAGALVHIDHGLPDEVLSPLLGGWPFSMNAWISAGPE